MRGLVIPLTLIAAILVAAGCDSQASSPQPSTQEGTLVPLRLRTPVSAQQAASPTPTPLTATPSPRSTPVAVSTLDCPRDQLKRVVDEFYLAYNRHDLAGVLSLFDFTSGFSYYDNVAGQISDIRERSELERYLQSRFALNDQITVVSIELLAQEIVPFCTTNPTVAFIRSDTNRQYEGNAKLVVIMGTVRAFVTSSKSVTTSPTATRVADFTEPTPRPGEISLAHHGVLFLDELPEFGSRGLEVLRQPLEDKIVSIARSTGTLTFPANFQLIAAMNPCPCGWYGDPSGRCACAPSTITRYQNRISGPVLDRIDIHVDVPRVEYEKLSAVRLGEPSAAIRPGTARRSSALRARA